MRPTVERGVVAGGEVAGPLDRLQPGVRDELGHRLGALVGEHIALRAPQHEHRAGERRRLLLDPFHERVEIVGRMRHVGRLLAEPPAEAVLPLPSAVGPLAQVATEALGTHRVAAAGGTAAISVAASSSEPNDSWRAMKSTILRTPSGSSRWPTSIRAIAATASGWSAATWIDTMPPSDAPTNAARLDAELGQQRGDGGGDDHRTEAGAGVERIGVAMARQVGGHDVVGGPQRRAQLLVHVGGLAPAVQAHHGAARPPGPTRGSGPGGRRSG